MKKQPERGNETRSSTQRETWPRRCKSQNLQLYEEAIGSCLDRELSLDNDVRALRRLMFQRCCEHFDLAEEDVIEDVARRQAFTFSLVTPIITPYRLVEGFLATEVAWAQRLPVIPGNLSIVRGDPHSLSDVEDEYPATAFFTQLKEVAGKVAKRVGGNEASAVQWLLSGGHPAEVSALTGRFRLSRDFGALSRIQLSIDPYCSKEQVSEFYEQLRKAVTGRERARTLSKERLRLMAEDGDPTAWKRFISNPLPFQIVAESAPKRLARWNRELINPRYRQLTTATASRREPDYTELKTYFADHFGSSISWDALHGYTIENVLRVNPHWSRVTRWFFGIDFANNNIDIELTRALEANDEEAFRDVLRRIPFFIDFCTSSDWHDNARLLMDI